MARNEASMLESTYTAENLPLKNFIDVHCHILPNVDDGATSLEMAMEMARMAAADGTSTIIATPHPNLTKGIGGLAKTRQLVEELQATLTAQQIPLRLRVGVECYLEPTIPQLVKAGQLTTLNNTRYLLIEFPMREAPPKVENFIYGLQIADFIPVIAHPERYKYVQEDLNWLGRLIELGCLSQITAGVFGGGFGNRARQTAEQLLQHNMAHLIATDAHNVERRPPGFKAALAYIANSYSLELARALAINIPGQVLTGQIFAVPQPEILKAKPFWKFWDK